MTVKKTWMTPFCGRLGTGMTKTGAGGNFELFCSNPGMASNTFCAGMAYVYDRNTALATMCATQFTGANTPGKCAAS